MIRTPCKLCTSSGGLDGAFSVKTEDWLMPSGCYSWAMCDRLLVQVRVFCQSLSILSLSEMNSVFASCASYLVIYRVSLNT